MDERVKYYIDSRMRGYFKQFPEQVSGLQHTITECCGSNTHLHVLPRGICVAVTTCPIDQIVRKEADPDFTQYGYTVSQDSFDFGDGRFLSMRFTHMNDLSVAGYPGEGPIRSDNILGKISTEGVLCDDTKGIAHLYVACAGTYLLPRLHKIYTDEWNAPWKQLSVEQRKEVEQYFLSFFKGSYVVTIGRVQDDYKQTYGAPLELMEPNKVYSSPLFNNRGYNKPEDYLQLNIYKF